MDLIEPIATGLLVAVLAALQPDARSVPLRVFPAMAGTAFIGVVAGTWR